MSGLIPSASQLKSGQEVCKAYLQAAFPEHVTLEDRISALLSSQSQKESTFQNV